MSDTPSPPEQLTTSERSSIIAQFQKYLMEQIRTHGIIFVLLGVAVWYFQNENVSMKSEIRACNDALIETYRVNQVQLLNVINNNTRALQDVPRN